MSISVYGMQETLSTCMRKLVTSANTLLTPYIHLLPISKMPNLDTLTDSQRDELTSQYVELVVDSMDMGTLIQIVTDNLIDYHNEGSFDELKESIICFQDEDLFDELVDNVTNETVLDINNTGGKY